MGLAPLTPAGVAVMARRFVGNLKQVGLQRNLKPLAQLVGDGHRWPAEPVNQLVRLGTGRLLQAFSFNSGWNILQDGSVIDTHLEIDRLAIRPLVFSRFRINYS
jgi:hypothetical protein